MGIIRQSRDNPSDIVACMPIGTTALTSVPPQVALLSLTTGHWNMQGIFVAARLGIADLLRDGPQSSAALAESAPANPRALCRLLRALSSVGIFYEAMMAVLRLHLWLNAS